MPVCAESLPTAGAEPALRTLRRASYAVIGAYALALAYRLGLFDRVLPNPAAAALARWVASVKAKTEPIGDPHRFALTRQHLLRVYGVSSLGMLCAAGGGGLFYACPTVPIVLPMALAIGPTALLLAVPRGAVCPFWRGASFGIACLGFGYSLAPIGWVAWDTLSVAAALLASTMAGLCLPLFLTRGLVSYVGNTQLLACAISCAALTTGPGWGRRADVNVLLTLQLLSNGGINLLHTIPTMVHFVRWGGSEAGLRDSVDPLKESVCVCAGAGYVVWQCLRWACRRTILTLAKDDVSGTTREMREQWGSFSRNSFPVRNMSGIGASLMLLVWYVRAVSQLQRGETVMTLEAMRKVCSAVSPISLLLETSGK